MMQFQETLWIHIFMSFTCLSLVGANQSSIFGGSVQGSHEPSATLTESASVTSRQRTTTNIQSSSVVKSQLTSSLEPSFSSNTLTSLTKLTSLTATGITTTRVNRSVDSSETSSSCWFCHLFNTPSESSSTSIKTSSIVPSETTSCWFCNFKLFTSKTVQSASSTTKQSASSTKQSASSTIQSGSVNNIKPSATSVSLPTTVNRISSTPTWVFSSSVIKDSVLSTHTLSTKSSETRSSSCWFCDLYHTSSVVPSTLAASSKATFLFMDDLINQLFKSTSSQSPSESNIKPTSMILTVSSVVNSISSTPSSAFSSSVPQNSILSTHSLSTKSLESSSSSCWFCHLYQTSSVAPSTVASSSKATFLFMDDLINQLFKSTSSQSLSESNIKPTSMILIASSAVNSISSTSSSAFSSPMIQNSPLSTHSLSTKSSESSSSSCWFCHLYDTPSVTPTTSSSSARTAATKTPLFIDDLISQLFKSTSSQSSSTSNIKPTSTIGTVSTAETTLSSLFTTSATQVAIDSRSTSTTRAIESSSSCWFCHFYHTPSTSSTTISSMSAAATDPSTSCWFCDPLFKSTTSQSSSGMTSTPTSVTVPSSLLVQTTVHTSDVTSSKFTESRITSNKPSITVTVKSSSTEGIPFAITATKSSFSTKSLSPSFVSLGLSSNSETDAPTSIQETKTQELNIISTESSPKVFSTFINSEPDSISGKSSSMASASDYVSSQKPESSLTLMPQSSSSQRSQSISSLKPQSSSPQKPQSVSSQMPQNSSTQQLKSSLSEKIQSSSSQKVQSSSSQKLQNDSSQKFQSSSSQKLQSSSSQQLQSSSSQKLQTSFSHKPQISSSQKPQSSSSQKPRSSSSQNLQSTQFVSSVSKSLDRETTSSAATQSNSTEQLIFSSPRTIASSSKLAAGSVSGRSEITSSRIVSNLTSLITARTKLDVITIVHSLVTSMKTDDRPSGIATVESSIPSETISKPFSIQSNMTQSRSLEITQFSSASKLSNQSTFSSLEVSLSSDSVLPSSPKVSKETPSLFSSNVLPVSLSTKALMSSLTFTDSSDVSSHSESTINLQFSSKVSSTVLTVSKMSTSSSLLEITKTILSSSLESIKTTSSYESTQLESSLKSSDYKTSSNFPSEYITSVVASTSILNSSSNSFDSTELVSNIRPISLHTRTATTKLLLQSQTTLVMSSESATKGSETTSKAVSSSGGSANATSASSMVAKTIISAATQQPKFVLITSKRLSSFGSETISQQLETTVSSVSKVADRISSTVAAASMLSDAINLVTISESPIVVPSSLWSGIPSSSTLMSSLGVDSISPTPASASRSIFSAIQNISTTISSENFTEIKSSFIPSVDLSGTSALSSFKVSDTISKITRRTVTATSLMINSTDSTFVSGTTFTSAVSDNLESTASVSFKSETLIGSSTSLDSRSLVLTSVKETVSQTESSLNTFSSPTSITMTTITIAESRTLSDSPIILTNSDVISATNTGFSSSTVSFSPEKQTSSLMSSLTNSSASMGVISASQNASESASSSTSTVSLTIEIPTVKPSTIVKTTTTASLDHSAPTESSFASPSLTIPKPLHTIGTGSASFTLEIPSSSLLATTESLTTVPTSFAKFSDQTSSTQSRFASPSFTMPKPLHTIGTNSATSTSGIPSLEPQTTTSSATVTSTRPPTRSSSQPSTTNVSSAVSEATASVSLSVKSSTISLIPNVTSGSMSESTASLPLPMETKSTSSSTVRVTKLSSSIPKSTATVSAPLKSSTSAITMSITTLSSSAPVDSKTPSMVTTVINTSSSVSEATVPAPTTVESTSTSMTMSVVNASSPVSAVTATMSEPVNSTVSSISPSTVSVTVSSAVLTTSTPAAAVNASTAGEEYWVETVLKVLKTVDVTTKPFKIDIEERFVVAFMEAFKRLEGKSDSLLKRKRRRRYTQAGDAAVHIQHITRKPNTTTVSVAYTVEKSGSLLEPEAAIDALGTLNTQELAIILKQVVDVKAEPYIKVVTPAPSTDGDSLSKLWIIGAVAGPVLAIILIVWLALCIYLKCCRTKAPEKQEEDGEPQLTSIKNTETQEVTQFSKAYDNQAYSEIPEQSSRQADKKGRTYEVNPQAEPEFIEAYKNIEITPLTNAGKTKQEPSVTVQNGTTIKDKALIEAETGQTPQKKKKIRKRNGSIEPLGPGSSDNSPRLKSNSEQSFLLQSSVSGDDEELKGRTDKERKKNKERLREKQQKKKDDEVRAYLEAQREIDKVLGAANGLPDVFVENSDSPNHVRISRQDSGVSNEPLSGEETLEEARMRMHQLLDDAFTLISPRESFQENDMSAIRRMQAIAKRHGDKISTSSPERQRRDSSTNSKPKISTVHLDSTKDLGQHIKHEPMHFDPGYSYRDFPLETWSPYRASDQVALISMPNTMETKLGGPKDKNKEKERPATSKPGRRPAANFETQESKSTGYLDEKYSSSSPQPIVLRTKDLASYVNVNSDKQPKEKVKARQNSLGKYAAMTSINGDVYLSGSTTTLSKQKDKGVPRGVSLEHRDKDFPRGVSLEQRDKGVPRGVSMEHRDKGVPRGVSLEHRDKGVPRGVSLEHKDKGVSNDDGIELKPMKRKGWASLQKHREPVPHKKNSDEVDVINDIQPTETSDDLIKSLRDELQVLKGSFNLDSESSKRSKKGSGMTEIV